MFMNLLKDSFSKWEVKLESDIVRENSMTLRSKAVVACLGFLVAL